MEMLRVLRKLLRPRQERLIVVNKGFCICLTRTENF